MASVSAEKQIRPQNYQMQPLHVGLPGQTAHIESNTTLNDNLDNSAKNVFGFILFYRV